MGESLEASIATVSWPKEHRRSQDPNAVGSNFQDSNHPWTPPRSAYAKEAKPCDVCKSSTALLFCGGHSAFLCIACDSNMHKNSTLRHGKVWVCEVCEQAPASFNCKADAAALCVTCDFDIHSANPLSQRHERTPVVPFFDRADLVLRSTTSALLAPIPERNDTKIDPCLAKSCSDSLASSVTYSNERSDLKSVEFLISEYDHQLKDSDYGMLINDQFRSGCDSVVPVQNMILPISHDQFIDHSPATCFEIDFAKSCINSYNKKNSFTAPSHRQRVSSSSMEVGVVPDGGSVAEVSYSYGRSMNSGIDLNESGGRNQGSTFPGIDREARVLRYREKRKNRKFQKTIRYASRKTYAEIRPRIKGRFAKRTEVDDCGIDQCFGTLTEIFRHS